MKANRIWIELDEITSPEQAATQCELANKVLRKLGIAGKEFWLGRHGYALTLDDAGTYTDLADRGYWFNLDVAAR